MKKVFRISIFAIVCNIIFSSCSMRELTKDESEVIYSHEVKSSKAELKMKILSFISEKFTSGKAVIQVNEDGLISGNSTILNLSQFLTIRTSFEYTFIVKYQDNSYKVKCIAKNLYNTDSNSTYDLSPSGWGQYATDIKKTFDDFDKSLNDYITSKIDNF